MCVRSALPAVDDARDAEPGRVAQIALVRLAPVRVSARLGRRAASVLLEDSVAVTVVPTAGAAEREVFGPKISLPCRLRQLLVGEVRRVPTSH